MNKIRMQALVWRRTTLLVALVLITEASTHNSDTNYRYGFLVKAKDLPTLVQYADTVTDEEYIRQIHSMYNTYMADVGDRVTVETNARIDTKYRTWKRNADIINSLLALPKGMNDAGR